MDEDLESAHELPWTEEDENSMDAETAYLEKWQTLEKLGGC